MIKGRISFLGDISLNDNYINAIIEGYNPFEAVSDELKKSEIVVGNLEAVAKTEKGENLDKKTRLGIDKSCLKLLNDIPLHIACLANNHVYDQLLDGFLATITYLDDNNIKYLGAKTRNIEKPLYNTFDCAGKNIVILNYVHSATNPLLPDDCAINLNIYNSNLICEEIHKFKKQNFTVILNLHWGMDNSNFPEPWQRNDARLYIDSGADLIIGHHSHVMQGFEVINDKYVFYSLGNFAFSPLKSNEQIYDVSERQRASIILNYQVIDTADQIEIIPIKLDGLNVIKSKSTKIYFLSKLIPLISNSLIWPFYKIYIGFVYKIYYYLFGNGRNPFQQLKKIDKKRILRLLEIIGIKKIIR